VPTTAATANKQILALSFMVFSLVVRSLVWNKKVEEILYCILHWSSYRNIS
jgi:hypothetical protein